MSSRRSVKKSVSADDARRSRAETTIKLRKNKKEEGLAKRRNFSGAAAEVEAAEAAFGSSSSAPAPVNVANIPNLMQMMSTGTPGEQVEGLRGFRRLLSSEQSPPVQECIDGRPLRATARRMHLRPNANPPNVHPISTKTPNSRCHPFLRAGAAMWRPYGSPVRGSLGADKHRINRAH